MIERLDRILCVLAHPDDEALLCFGTLNRLASMGKQIRIVFLTDGGQGRNTVVSKVMNMIGADYLISDFSTSNLLLDRKLIGFLDDQLRDFQPEVVVTHPNCEYQHQDHNITSLAATMAAYRYSSVASILQTEPTLTSEGFKPNYFVHLSKSDMMTKLDAIKIYSEVLDRWYMSPEVVTLRAKTWSLRSPAIPADDSYYEAFQLLLYKT